MVAHFLVLKIDNGKCYCYIHKYLGIKFGNNVRILHYPRWGSEPFLIEIGDNVTITRGVSFVNHDGGVALFRDEFKGLNSFGKIKVGNNVFIGHGVMFTNDTFDSDLIENWNIKNTIVGDRVRIGSNSTILPVKIGNNVIIGAGSVVTKDIPDNVTVYGNPARIK